MFPWHQGYNPNFTLHYDDITAIQALYGESLEYLTTYGSPYIMGRNLEEGGGVLKRSI